MASGAAIDDFAPMEKSRIQRPPEFLRMRKLLAAFLCVIRGGGESAQGKCILRLGAAG